MNLKETCVNIETLQRAGVISKVCLYENIKEKVLEFKKIIKQNINSYEYKLENKKLLKKNEILIIEGKIITYEFCLYHLKEIFGDFEK